MTRPAQTMPTIPGDVAIRITRHARSKRLSMRYDMRTKQVIVSAPSRVAMADIHAFVQRHATDMASYIASLPQAIELRYGAIVPKWGVMHIITRNESDCQMPSWRFDCHDEVLARTMRKQAEMLLREAVANIEQRLWKHQDFAAQPRPSRITLRDTRSRWGSCGSNGRLMLSWRLIFMPYYVADYIIIHEYCHLLHPNHSPAFWRCCERHTSRMSDAKRWLKMNGASVFMYN